MARLFLSQDRVDTWMSAGGAGLDGDFLVLNAIPDQKLWMTVAVSFVRVDGAESDAYDLVGAVKTAAELQQMGAEHYETSVVVGEHAYSVTPGFMAIPIDANGNEAALDPQNWGRIVSTIEQLGVF